MKWATKWTVPLALLAVLLTPSPAHADGLLTPFLGWDFSGDAGDCPDVPNCSSRQGTYGVSMAFMIGGVVGLEGDFAHAPHFFGDAPGRGDNYVVTAMVNVIAGIPAGPVRPYAVGGIGLLHTNISPQANDLFNALSNNDVAIDFGGGMMGFFATHVGLRGDIRYVRSLGELSFSSFNLSNKNLEFWRGTIGVTFRF